jgi:hypothetical protein
VSDDKQSISPGRTWIDTHLTQKETEGLVSDLMELSAHPTGLQIQALVREMKGNAPSERSCLEWRNNTYVPLYLRSRRSLAERITAVQAANGNTSAATAALMRQANLDLILEVGATNPKVLQIISNIEGRLREGDLAERDLASKIAARDELIAQFKRKEEDWKRERAEESERKKKASAVMDRLEKKGGLSKEGRAALNAELYGTDAASDRAEASAGGRGTASAEGGHA